jgi:hypothetical protein
MSTARGGVKPMTRKRRQFTPEFKARVAVATTRAWGLFKPHFSSVQDATTKYWYPSGGFLCTNRFLFRIFWKWPVTTIAPSSL